MAECVSVMPLISVVVPTFNRADLLRQALRSVFLQDFRDFEVIVVDDGSTEDLRDVIQDFQHQATFLRQDNAGPGAARNRGCRSARGQYLAFLDSDDVWFPWTLSVLAKLIEEHRSPAMLSGVLTEFSDESELANVIEERTQVEIYDDFFASSGQPWNVGSGTLAVRRDEFEKVGGFTERHINAEDHDLVLRLGASPGFVKLQGPFTLGCRRHSGNVTLDHRKTFEGVRQLVNQEQRRAYPGGQCRSRERQEILARHVRPVVVQCLKDRMWQEAWQLYRATLLWQFRLGRWKFLSGVPAMALAMQARRRWA